MGQEPNRHTPKRIPAAPFAALLSIPRRLFFSGPEGGRVPLIGLPWVLFAFFLFLGGYYAFERERSYFLDLVTDQFEVITDADAQIVWELSDVLICVPKHKLTEASAWRDEETPRTRCDPTVYVESWIDYIDLDWPSDLNLTLRSGPGGTLDILIRHDGSAGAFRIDGREVPSETLMNIPNAVFAEFGGLGLSGSFRAGQLAENGTHLLLRSGRFETREHDWSETSSRLVDSGSFSLGDVVSIESVDAEDSVGVYTFFMPTKAAQGSSSLRLIVTTEVAKSRLRLERVRSKVTFLEPGWVHRLTNDPLAIGFATILGLFGSLLAVMNVLFRRK